MDNIGDSADLVVTGIPRPHRRQPDSHPNRGGSDHLDIQPGLWPARLVLRRDSRRKEPLEEALENS